MSLEQIQLLEGKEQEVLVPYGKEILKLVIQFDDYSTQWFLNIINDVTQEIIVNGIYLILEKDALFGLGLDFGSLGLTDTDPNNEVPVDLKNDLGGRIQLIRDIDA